MECHSCGYDMSATPRARKCPECGSSEWNVAKEGWTSIERVCFVAAVAPNVAFLVYLAMYATQRIMPGHQVLVWGSEMVLAIGCVPAAILHAAIVPSHLCLAVIRKVSWRVAGRCLLHAISGWGLFLMLVFIVLAGIK